MIGMACGYDFKEEGIYAVFDTNMGDMVLKLNYEKAPVTVGNFVGLAEGTQEFINMKTNNIEKRPFYNGLVFHRVIDGFMIQGGCPLGRGTGGPGYSFVDEFDPGLKHDSAGILSMANSGPDSNGSQFFITLAPAPHLDGRHTVLGKLVSGMNVLEQIGHVKTDSRDKPLNEVRIRSVKIKRVGKNAQAFDAGKAFAKNEEVLKERDKANEQKLKDLLKSLKINPDKIKTTQTGLQYVVKRAGKGGTPEPGDQITAHYAGYLVDGKKFDSSFDRGQPFSVQIGVGNVIPGWDEAFLDMKTGEKRILIIPYELAYGARGRPPVIPPRAKLIFDVELLKITGK
ncbi:MAG: peptidylprolyl isomerase [Spirochaetes bacterium]|nr:peptidylprolyl isomerase [Spirochaetota bacterium]